MLEVLSGGAPVLNEFVLVGLHSSTHGFSLQLPSVSRSASPSTFSPLGDVSGATSAIPSLEATR